MAREIRYVNNTGGATTTATQPRPLKQVSSPQAVTQPTLKPQGAIRNFIDERGKDIKALVEGDVTVSQVVKGIPAAALGGAKKTAEVVAPALTNFTKTTGGILGEGLAYSADKNVREQYKAGNLDILPNVTKTTQGGLLKDTIAAGLEAAILRSVPAAMKGSVATRAGIGGLEGIGFAVSEGLAKDQSVEQMIDNAKLYGVSGAALNVAVPWLGPVLRKEIGRAPKAVIDRLKEEAAAGASATKSSLPEPISTPATPTTVVPGPVNTPELAPNTGAQQVPSEQIPIGGPTKGPSSLEARLVAQVEDPTYQAGVSNYGKYSKEADAPEVTGSSNVEQIRRAAQSVENLNPNQINDIISGTTELPQGVLRTAFIRAAGEKALLEGNTSLINRLGRVAGQAARRFGQEIQFTKNFDPLDPVTNIADILSVRLKAAERKFPKGQTASSTIKNDVGKGRKLATESQIKLKDAENLIDSILC